MRLFDRFSRAKATRDIPLAVLAALIVASMPAARGEAGADRVTVLAAPRGGIQPQAAIDASGVIHLVCYEGPPAGGDLSYVRIEPGRPGFSPPIRVNSQPASAMALGTIRGAQLALGGDGRVHVAWNGTPMATPPNPRQGAPMLYTRSNPSRTEFEPQRNLMQRTFGLDGGGSLAADGLGNVYVAWHGRTDDDPANEAGRRVWLARSRDEGATFAAEAPASGRPTGACACCGTKALADSSGRLFLLYRTATDGGSERGMALLASGDRGATFRSVLLQPWRLNACPMSSAAFAVDPSGPLAAWETKGQVFFARHSLDASGTSPTPVAPPGDTRDRKHPALAVNARGEVLLAWTEGTAWQRGGALVWQMFDHSGRPLPESGRIEKGIPTWSLPAVVARPDGGFTIIH